MPLPGICSTPDCSNSWKSALPNRGREKYLNYFPNLSSKKDIRICSDCFVFQYDYTIDNKQIEHINKMIVNNQEKTDQLIERKKILDLLLIRSNEKILIKNAEGLKSDDAPKSQTTVGIQSEEKHTEQPVEKETEKGQQGLASTMEQQTKEEKTRSGETSQQGGLHAKQMHYKRDPTLEFFNKMVARDTHNVIGRSGLKVCRITLGTMNFGEIDSNFGERPGQLNESEAHKLLDKYVELGGNCIDTANFFPWFGNKAGESERIIGNWLKNQDRRKIILITKIRMPTDFVDVNAAGLSRKNIINSVDQCLERLQTDYIDLLQLDGYDNSASLSETVRHLNDLVTVGKISHFGVCDFKGYQLQKIIDVTREKNFHKCIAYSGEYNLLTRGCEFEVTEVCRNENIGFFAYAPLKYGSLSNAFTSQPESPASGSRIEAASQSPNLASMAASFEDLKKNPIFMQVLNRCENIAKEKNISISQVALLWALQRKVTSVIIGVNNIEELEENMKLLHHEACLTHEEMRELNELSRICFQYPYNINLPSIGGNKFVQFGPNSSFEQLSVLMHTCSLEPHEGSPERKSQLCQESPESQSTQESQSGHAKVTRHQSLTTPKHT